MRHPAFSIPHLLRLAGFPSLPQAINILLFFVLSMTHSRHDIFTMATEQGAVMHKSRR